MKIQPDNVYVIPPAVYMTITDGHLVLSQKHKADKQPHVFDYFLQSLAPIYQHKAIAIVLSGVGFDGTLGVEAVKAEGGISFAQDDSALFQSMARNAYESGYIAPRQLPLKINFFYSFLTSLSLCHLRQSFVRLFIHFSY